MAMPIKRERPEYGVLISLAGTIIIAGCSMGWVIQVVDFIQGILGATNMDNSYFVLILKMLGITYCADFSSNMCRDAGHSALAGQIEIFAKLSIIALSIPGLEYFVSVMESFL